jgi:hypothetical protein
MSVIIARDMPVRRGTGNPLGDASRIPRWDGRFGGWPLPVVGSVPTPRPAKPMSHHSSAAWEPAPPDMRGQVTVFREVDLPLLWPTSSKSPRRTTTSSSLPPDDARADARWRGRRLPSAARWRLAFTAGSKRRSPSVWKWADGERTDGVTRYSLLRSDSWFEAVGSRWCVDGGGRPPEWELKLDLPGGGLDRSECVGFRCAVDVTADGPDATEANRL